MCGQDCIHLVRQELPKMMKAGMERRKRMRELLKRIIELRRHGLIPEIKKLEAEYDELKAKGKKLIKHNAV